MNQKESEYEHNWYIETVNQVHGMNNDQRADER